MKQFLLIFLILLGYAFTVNAQQNKLIHLKDGSKVQGHIVDANADLVKIILKDGGELLVPSENIVSMKDPRRQISIDDQGIQTQIKGWFFHPQIYFLTAFRAGTSIDSDKVRNAMGRNFTVGYLLNRHFGIGVGAGLDFYEKTMLPLSVNIRGDITKKNPSVYYSLTGGYSLPSGEWFDNDDNEYTFKGGAFYYPALGLKFSYKKPYALTVDIGYNFQHQDREFDWWRGEATEKVIYKSLAIRAGIQF